LRNDTTMLLKQSRTLLTLHCIQTLLSNFTQQYAEPSPVEQESSWTFLCLDSPLGVNGEKLG